MKEDYYIIITKEELKNNDKEALKEMMFIKLQQTIEKFQELESKSS